MNFWAVLEKRLIIGLSAAQAMHALLVRQQDLSLNMSQDTVVKRCEDTSKMAVAFAKALWKELATDSY